MKKNLVAIQNVTKDTFVNLFGRKNDMKSIKTKIVALTLCCVFLSTIAISALSLWELTEVLYASAENNLQLVCQKSADELDDLLETTEIVAFGIASQMEDVLQGNSVLKNKTAGDTYVEKILGSCLTGARGTDGVLGVYVNFYLEDGAEATYSWQRTGLRESFSSVPENEHAIETERDEAYKSVKESCKRGVPCWTGRYNCNHLGVPLISYVTPLLYNNQILGFMGIEFAWDIIEREIKNIHAFKGEKIFLFSETGRILFTPIVEDGETPSDEILSGLMMYKTRGKEVLSYEKNGQKGKLVYTPLRNGMQLCVSAPDRVIYKQQNEFLWGIVYMFLGILLGVLAFALFWANRMMKPLKKLEYATRKMSQGDFSVDIMPESEDEVGELTETFIETREKLKKQMWELASEAFHDELTGANNKAALAEVEAQINQEIQTESASFEVAVLDVNMLKFTNDTLGHSAGDVLLKTVSDKLIQVFGSEYVFRIGGDEFLILSQRETRLGALLKACMKELETDVTDGNTLGSITCAYGTAVYNKKTDNNFADVVARADKEMYKNKSKFRKKSALWSTDTAGLRKIQIEKYIEFLRVLGQSTEDYLFLLDLSTKRNWFFGAIQEKFDIHKNEEGTNSLEEILAITHPGDREELRADLERIIKGESVEHHMEYRWFDKNGAPIWINCRGKVISDETGKPFVMIGRVSDSATRIYYNSLTGLFNKEKFRQDMQGESPLQYNYLMLLHVDNMGEYNMKYGRNYGDAILRELAFIFEERFSVHSVYHMEQDRFALLLPMEERESVQTVFSDVQQAITGQFTVSAVVVPNDKSMYTDEEDIYEVAKESLKANRDKGNAKLVFFTKEELNKKNTSAELLKELELSVQNHAEGFWLCYQPQIDGKTLSVVGAEALLRYKSKSKGPVFPDEFIPILERTGLINEVGLWVLNEALKMCRKWREFIPDFRMSVNFSAVQLQQEDLIQKILFALEKNELPSSALTIEITESAELDKTRNLPIFFEELEKAGVRISIDDFGTGYANLAYLRKIHANEIKIDRMFLHDIEKNSYNYDVISNTMELAHTNTIRVCLEGIEKVEELAVVESLHPDVLQGYLFDKPLAADVFEETYVLQDTNAYKEKRKLTEEIQRQSANMHVIRVNTKEILSETNIGLWVIRMKGKGENGELFADQTMYKLLGADPPLSPEECYRYWYNRIEPEHLQIVHTMLEKMSEADTVTQAEYRWNHPAKGKVFVRCTGKCVKKENGITLFEGFHRITSDAHEVE